MQTNTFSRCLEAIFTEEKDAESNWFMLGTGDIHSSNEVQLVNFDSNGESGLSTLNSTLSYRHPGVITSLSPCPQDYRLFFSCHSSTSNHSGTSYGATLWQFPGDVMRESLASLEFSNNGTLSRKSSTATELEPLIPLATLPYSKTGTLPNHQGFIKVLWDPSGYSQKVVTLTHQSISSYSISTDMSSCLLSKDFFSTTGSEISQRGSLTCGVWHETSGNVIAGVGSSIVGCDPRMPPNSSVYEINHAHQPKVLGVDGNPHLAHRLVSGGQDGLVKCWDTRNLQRPLTTVSHHTHWIWSVSHNRKYDQLVLASGSDGCVTLESLPSVSSTSHLNHSLFLDGSSPLEDPYPLREGVPVDHLVASYTSHEDSVYSAVWSTSNPWGFASLSYDGQLLFHQVPDNEKYAILL